MALAWRRSSPRQATLTVAWRESGLTLTSVTSTSSRRGASHSKPMILARFSRAASETRNVRRSSMRDLFQPLDGGGDEGRADVAGGLLLHAVEDLFGVDVVAGHGDGGQGGALPEILMIDLGNGHVEFVAEAVFEAG